MTNKFKTQIRSKQLEILTASEYDWFGHIPKEDVSYNLDKIYSQAKKEGYEGLLLTSDGEYIGKELGIRNLFKAESYINQAIKNKSIVVVCMYSANETALDPRINDLLLSHTYLLNNDNFINIKEKMEREKINDEQILEEILK